MTWAVYQPAANRCAAEALDPLFPQSLESGRKGHVGPRSQLQQKYYATLRQHTHTQFGGSAVIVALWGIVNQDGAVRPDHLVTWLRNKTVESDIQCLILLEFGASLGPLSTFFSHGFCPHAYSFDKLWPASDCGFPKSPLTVFSVGRATANRRDEWWRG